MYCPVTQSVYRLPWVGLSIRVDHLVSFKQFVFVLFILLHESFEFRVLMILSVRLKQVTYIVG